MTDETHPIDSTTDVAEPAVLQEQLDALESKYKRALADSANLVRQHGMDVQAAVKRGKTQLLHPVVQMLNTLTLAIDFLSTTLSDTAALDSIRTSLTTCIEDLKKESVEILRPGIGEDFDAATMQALNAGETSKISKLVSLGYKVDGHLVQPAIVMLEES
jgi:molecular chaperone GrpE (heat shock protein)